MTSETLSVSSSIHSTPSSVIGAMADINNHSNDLDNFGGQFHADDGYMLLSVTFSIVRLCLAIFGVLANTITGLVLINKRIWSPTSLLLLTLVVYDALFLLASIPLCVIDAFVQVDMETFAVICGVVYPLRYMAQTGSIYTTVTLTIERFLIVLRPLQARIFCTFGKIKRVTFAVLIFSLVFNIPRCFFYLLATAFGPMPMNSSILATNMTLSPWENAAFNEHPQDISAQNESLPYVLTVGKDEDKRMFYTWLYLRVYELYISGVFFYLLPYALIPILNIQLLLAIKRRREETRRISVKYAHQLHSVKATDREDGLTMIVLGITVCFFICCLVPAVYNVTQIAEVPPTTAVQAYLLIASDTMLCLNASTDFFFYCLLGKRFRTIFVQLFCRRSVMSRSSTINSHSRYNDTVYHSV